MKILGICGSARSEKKSGCYKLTKTVLDASGCEYELITMRGKKILGCTSCLGCIDNNVCVINDDMAELREKFIEADAFVIAAPNFYSGMNATTHALLERFYQFRHQEGDFLWGKLAVAVGVGGSSGECVTGQIETFMGYNFIDTIASVSGQGAACCFTCGYGETCRVGAVHMFFGPGTKITEDMIPNVEKQPAVIQAAIDAGKELGRRLTTDYDRQKTTQKMQQQMMTKFKEST